MRNTIKEDWRRSIAFFHYCVVFVRCENSWCSTTALCAVKRNTGKIIKFFCGSIKTNIIPFHSCAVAHCWHFLTILFHFNLHKLNKIKAIFLSTPIKVCKLKRIKERDLQERGREREKTTMTMAEEEKTDEKRYTCLLKRIGDQKTNTFFELHTSKWLTFII